MTELKFGCWDFDFCMTAMLLSIFSLLFLPFSYVYFSYLFLAVPMHECLGEHSCMTSSYLITILIGNSIFCEV